jgi:hypothetical protein
MSNEAKTTEIKTKLEVAGEPVTRMTALTLVVGEAIQKLGEIPSGHLYAAVMSRIDLETYEKIITALVAAKRVRRDRSHLLTWVGVSA